ncbi:leucine rich repeat family protein [Anaeramoeba flamelloides]|uniref:Leucine rich repeat family protein n=1 Tax=Anaeramoeba flamelloides TaxID=1746091 RepID=A0ABQ8XMB2_9EUKA|nr:leucine rich repeat family protein [Anaeramoeba flamelloides]
MKTLSEALKMNHTLTKLNLRLKGIGDKGTQVLSESLKVNKTLINLNLCFNEIGDKGMKILSKALKVNQKLTELDLSANRIGDEGMKSLSVLVLVFEWTGRPICPDCVQLIYVLEDAVVDCFVVHFC